DIFTGFKVLATDGKNAQPIVVKVVEVFAPMSPKMTALKGHVKVAGHAAEFIGLLVNSAIWGGRGDDHIVAGELYKIAISNFVPWGALLDAVQSVIDAVYPSSKSDPIFKYFRAINPVAMGGIAVDSLGTIIQCFIAEKGNEQRLARLTERMRDAGAGVF